MARKYNERNREAVYPRGTAFSDELIIKNSKLYKPRFSVRVPTLQVERVIKQGKKRDDTKRRSNKR